MSTWGGAACRESRVGAALLLSRVSSRGQTKSGLNVTMSRYQLSPGITNGVFIDFFFALFFTQHFQAGAFGYSDNQTVNNYSLPALLQSDIVLHLPIHQAFFGRSDHSRGQLLDMISVISLGSSIFSKKE